MTKKSKNKEDIYIDPAIMWFEERGWTPFSFQKRAWEAYLTGESGIINAPTGSGKTYSLFIPAALEALHKRSKGEKNLSGKLQLIWITPIRALTKEIQMASTRAAEGLGLGWKIAIRSGDTTNSQRQKLRKSPPEMLITTPESLHILMASKRYEAYFRHVKAIVIDEWHELLGSKRGVQVELALSRLKVIARELKIWGISATIGNMDQAGEVLLGDWWEKKPSRIIRSTIKKRIEVVSVLPEEIERFPWAGHLGIRMLEQVLPIIRKSRSTLIFTNTRSQCEIWYQRILDIAPDMAGWIAMHHGSISRRLRDWVEGALHEEKLKAVVCTSSLDLGVDFRPVETIIQIGSPKGVARFIQRAGRSGHQPGAVSKIFFVPTHSLELVESAALREAVKQGWIEDRIPHIRSFDVLIQYLMTLGVSDGFYPSELYEELKGTFSFNSMTEDEWAWILDFLVNGGSLSAYDEYRKMEIDEAGKFHVSNRRIARMHRLSIGTIVSDVSMSIKYVSGKRVGTVEEWFIAQLKPGDVFWFAGRSLELVRIKGLTAYVRKSKANKGRIPSWMGGRMSLSSELSEALRMKIHEGAMKSKLLDLEISTIEPLLKMQAERSSIPSQDEFLIEYFISEEGHHLLMYPFEGRFVHEGMASVIAYRLARIKPISFSIAMNDYGFELLSDSEIPVQQILDSDMLSYKNLRSDIEESVNSIEMARRRFRDIASISGLVFRGYPGKEKKERHLQSSASLFFDVFKDYEPENLLFLQAYDEAMNFQLEESRLRQAFKRTSEQKIILSRPEKATPFAFPIMVDRLRDKLTSEKLEDRIRKMQLRLA